MSPGCSWAVLQELTVLELCVQAVGHLESIVHSPAACAQYSRMKSASQSSGGGAPLELVGPQVSLDLMRPSSRLRVG